MNREEMLEHIQNFDDEWDCIIIGGGATGLGNAIEAASRGYKTLLLEQNDFGSGTSSRSTKLIHGGIRYLQQGNVSLVLEALKERGILRRNAPHLVHNLQFIVPNYDWWEGPFYGIGLKLYDMLAGKEGFGSSKFLSKDKTLGLIPTIETKGLRGGIVYYDGQFDDARLIINMAETAVEQGAVTLNYMKVKNIIKHSGFVKGVIAEDLENSIEYTLEAKVIINATGVFTDSIRKMDDKDAVNMITPSQGVHIILERSFLPGDSAIMVPHTDDGRVLFAIPWHDRIIVGTTDTPVDTISTEPVPLAEEISFLLEHAARYLTKDPGIDDILSAFAGLRPLVSQEHTSDTATISRDHTLHISNSGLVTITGGKWTTYRKMAEETIDHASILADLEPRETVTRDLNIHGYHSNPGKSNDLKVYGSDRIAIEKLLRENPSYAEKLHSKLSIYSGEVIWAVRYEMARTLEDFLFRRTRAILIDAISSIEIAPKVAGLMAKELGRDISWQKKQIKKYIKLAQTYIPKSVS